MAEESDFMKRFGKVLETSMKFKRIMLKKGITSASVPCDECEGKLHGRISGSRNHFRMWCDGTCGARMIE